jgi:HSP20 family protein
MITLFKDPFFTTLDKVLDDSYFNRMSVLGSNKQTNITKNENEYLIQIAVPGLTKNDIKITLNENVINISHESQETDEKTFSFTNSFKKSYTLPEDVDEKNIKGSVENGVLNIVLPKNKKKPIERFISIN